MGLTDQQRVALHHANTKGGTTRRKGEHHNNRKAIRSITANRLIDLGLVIEVNQRLITTKAGRAELQKPLPHRPRYLARPTANAGDYTEERHRAIDDLEVIPPSKADVDEAAKRGAEQRASFRRDLEEERRRRKSDRVDRMFRAA